MGFALLREEIERQLVIQTPGGKVYRRFYITPAAGSSSNIPDVGTILPGYSSSAVLAPRSGVPIVGPHKDKGQLAVQIDWTAGRSWSG